MLYARRSSHPLRVHVLDALLELLHVLLLPRPRVPSVHAVALAVMLGSLLGRHLCLTLAIVRAWVLTPAAVAAGYHARCDAALLRTALHCCCAVVQKGGALG